MKKVFLEDLPKRGKSINWTESIGQKVKFIYKDIKNEIKIIDYDKKLRKISLMYLDKDIFEINTSSFQNCNLGKLLGKYTK